MSGWSSGSTRRWRKVRLFVLVRDRWRCQVRIPGVWRTTRGSWTRCQGAADCAHHLLGKAVTGDDPLFMVASCTPCNLHVGEPSKRADPPHRPMTRW